MNLKSFFLFLVASLFTGISIQFKIQYAIHTLLSHTAGMSHLHNLILYIIQGVPN